MSLTSGGPNLPDKKMVLMLQKVFTSKVLKSVENVGMERGVGVVGEWGRRQF